MKVKNVSNLTKTLAVVSLLAPASAQPLGIGDIELHSALNQNLNASIKLSVAAGENPSDISVRLAPVEKFDQAGVPWNYFLSKIKLEPVIQANGNVIVKVTSREALTEPFLDFLLEVSWPQGSQIREYTLLIDPPADYHSPVVPSAESGGVRVEALEDYDRPARKSRSSSKRRQSRPEAGGITPQTPSSGEYGPVRNQDTLWGIAEQLGAERNVPTRQMLNALYQANPDAFNNGNMDLLKAGVTLKIPETEAIVQGAPAQPSTKRGEVKPPKEAAVAPKSVAASNKGLELVAPTDAKIADNAKVGSQAKSGADATSGSVGAAGGEAVSGKDRELQSRIEKLEQQLGMMQQLLALKDQQLANLQNKDKAVADQGLPAAPKSVVPSQPKSPAVTEPQPPVGQPPIAPPSQELVVQQPPAPATPQPAPPQAKPKPKPPKPVAPPVSEESGWLSSSGYYLSVGGLGVGILGALGWLWWRKRRIEDQTNTESMFASASQIKMPDTDSSLSVPVMEMTGAGSYDVGTVGESSFISDFTPSDFDAFDTDQNEVDPMSEADVYLAYGRYQQAEDLIRHAIEEQPARDEYKLKLLEILYANENRDAFAVYAQQLADAGKQADRPFWTKVSDMAKELIPESALFGGTEAVPAVHAKADFDLPVVGAVGEDASAELYASDSEAFSLDALSDDLVDLDAPTLPDMVLMDDVSSELAELQLTGAEPASTADNGLDFDLSSFSTDSADKSVDQAEQSRTDIETIDFDLSSFSIDTKAEEKSGLEQEAAEDKLESFDFNFDFDEPKPAVDDQAEVEQPLDMASLESYEFPDFDVLAADKDTTVQAEPAAATKAESSADEFDFNFDFDAPISLSDDESGIGSGVSDLTDMDEFETKIDLAKAYIDMGDAEAARAIAQEVLEKGSKEQKAAAQAILDELE